MEFLRAPQFWAKWGTTVPRAVVMTPCVLGVMTAGGGDTTGPQSTSDPL